MSPGLLYEAASVQDRSPRQPMTGRGLVFRFFSRGQGANTPKAFPGALSLSVTKKPMSSTFCLAVSAPRLCRPRPCLPLACPIMRSAGPALSRYPRFACRSNLYCQPRSAGSSLFLSLSLSSHPPPPSLLTRPNKSHRPYLLTSGSSPGQSRTLRTPWAGCRRHRAA